MSHLLCLPRNEIMPGWVCICFSFLVYTNVRNWANRKLSHTFFMKICVPSQITTLCQTSHFLHPFNYIFLYMPTTLRDVLISNDNKKTQWGKTNKNNWSMCTTSVDLLTIRILSRLFKLRFFFNFIPRYNIFSFPKHFIKKPYCAPVFIFPSAYIKLCLSITMSMCDYTCLCNISLII